MKIFVVLVVSVALCSAASKPSEKSNKKRSLLGLGTADYGNFPGIAPYPDLAHSFQSAAPLASAPLAGPHFAAAPFTPYHSNLQFEAQQIPIHGFAQAQPIQHAVAPVLPAFAPTQHEVQPIIKTLVKHVHVPYERRIPIDNPIYTPVERQIPVDNPVPVVKIVKRPIPIHVEQPVPIAVVKEIRENVPYKHRVRLVFQQVYVKNQEAPRQQYLPPPQQQHFDAPAAPSQNYIPPQQQHFDAPAAPSQSYIPPQQQHFDAPAPPATSYGIPEQKSQQPHFDAPSPSDSYLPPQQQHFDAPAVLSKNSLPSHQQGY